jgi:hypothetical protein
VARQGQAVVGVVAMVDVGNRQMGFKNGGFQGHGAVPVFLKNELLALVVLGFQSVNMLKSKLDKRKQL